MILTITANPSVDISYELENFKIDDVNRTNQVIKDAGGKGIHVGYVLNELGEDVVHSGFVGGALGEYIKNTIKNKGQESRFIDIGEDTRNCIAVLHEGNQTEILEKGPTITTTEENDFIEKLDEITKGCDYINVSGSLPNGLNASFYERIIAYAKEKNKFISVDTSGKTLETIINAGVKPDLIKPNESEIGDVLKTEVSKDNLVDILLREPFKDIRYIIASMGKDGAIVKIDNKVYKANVPEVEAINPVGSGDSSLAGAIYAISKDKDDIDIIKTSMTCGLLNVLNKEIAHINMDDFDKYYEQIEVEEI
ncbi:hexose kinase [Anaerococcus sp.]|uniref:hexose kinase n=1 Tax=Anaerococcus sp. TaxID=1872515 RepID=UPI0029041C3E|nr:hexose kinase [Anaerococcus sp.]MDU1828227.1 hexose kinase [Anaerococcus sp.]MDU1864413.1 hexose kinase [Anaerococcus sp.]MDU2565180.1 hexose kinase [Anaerococcus sp.]